MAARKKPVRAPRTRKQPTTPRTRRVAAKPTTTSKYVVPAGAQRASDVEARKIEWLVEQKIPCGMISLVFGRPGQGKSMFSAWLAAEVSQKHGAVIFSNLEDLRAEVTRPRLEAARARLDRVHFWQPEFETAAGLAQLREFVEQFKVRLIVLDPIAAHVKASIWNDQAIRRVLTPLKEKVLEPTGAACLIVAHTTKKVAKNAHALEAVGGSGGGMAGAARAVFVFGKNPDVEDERILASAKENVAKAVSMAFEMDESEISIAAGTSTITAPRLVLIDADAQVNARKVLSDVGTEGKQDPVKTAVAAEWLTSYLMFGPRHATEVRDDGLANGMTWTTLRRAGEKLGIVRIRVGNGNTWELPQGHPALTVASIAAPVMKAQKIAPTPGTLTVEDVLRMIDAGKNGGQTP